MKRILVATDGSAGADRALDVASTIAARFDAELIIVTVNRDICREIWKNSGDHLTQRSTILNAVSLKFWNTLRKERIATVFRGFEQSSLGDAVAFILEVAAREKADTIVVGKRGRGRLVGLLIGSVSQKLISLAGCAWVP